MHSKSQKYGDSLRSETRESTNPASSSLTIKPSHYKQKQQTNNTSASTTSISDSVRLLEEITGPYRRVEIIESWLHKQALRPPPFTDFEANSPIITEGAPTVKAADEDETVICGESLSLDFLVCSLRACEKAVGLFEFSFPEFALHCTRLRNVLIKLAGCVHSQVGLPDGVEPSAMRVWIHKTIPEARTLRHWINVILWCRDTHDSEEKLSEFCYKFEKQLQQSFLDEDDPKYFMVDPEFKCKKGPRTPDPQIGELLNTLSKIYDQLHDLTKIYPKQTLQAQDLASHIQSIQLDLSRRDAEGVPVEPSPSLVRVSAGLQRWLSTLLERKDFIYHGSSLNTIFADLSVYSQKFAAQASSLRLGISRTSLTTLISTEISQYRSQKALQEEKKEKVKREYLRVLREGREGRKLRRRQIKGMIEVLRGLNEAERGEMVLEEGGVGGGRLSGGRVSR